MGRLKGSKNGAKSIRFDALIYRLNISYISGYGTFQILGKDTKRVVDRCSELDLLKSQVIQKIIFYQKSRGLRYYSIAWQTHRSTGEPHLDILLTYDKKIKKRNSSFNYLLQICSQRPSETTPGVFITPYTKTRFNKAVLEYGSKEDPSVITNFPEDISSILLVNAFQKDPYLHLYNQMCKDPLYFNLQQYVKINQLSPYISNWSSIKTKLKDMQTAAANLLLKNKPGFKFISRDLIESNLTPSELKLFDSWSGYQTIVDYLNQVPKYGFRRPLKTKNLLITGPTSTGKTSLVQLMYPEPFQNPISRYCSVYKMGVAGWFPEYRSEVNQVILWNQAKLTSYSYDTILELLEGSAMSLPTKGGFRRKIDNPLIIMTSNMTLDEMIYQKFSYNKDYIEMAKNNLSTRIQNVIVPPGYDLFILQKLLVPL